ncbi:MAG: hypothetical protein VB078_10795 [Clostridiaceae bacterium]|nr:hypothetical protein [Clostridiaceae bacterium]
MDFNVIREYLIADTELHSLVGDNVFLFERPEKVKCSDYITYTFKELNGGGTIRQYQLDIRVISKDKIKLLAIKDRVIKLLDVYNRPTSIKNADGAIRICTLINGGGIARNDEGEYYAFVYFLIKT